MAGAKTSILSTKNSKNLKETWKKKGEKVKFLKKENSYLNKRLDEMDALVDRQGQYSRRSCLLVHGTVEETVENTDEKIINTLQQSMDEKIKPEDNDRSHRLGKPKCSMANLLQ